MAVSSIDTPDRTVVRDIPAASTIARLAIRRAGAATVTVIQMATWITARASVATGSVHQDAPSALVAVALTTIAAAARGQVARAARSAVAARLATRTTTSIPVRRWLRPRIRTTRCVAHATSCSAIRQASVAIDLGGKQGVEDHLPPSAFVLTI